jgi:hypothetical protein
LYRDSVFAELLLCQELAQELIAQGFTANTALYSFVAAELRAKVALPPPAAMTDKELLYLSRLYQRVFQVFRSSPEPTLGE